MAEQNVNLISFLTRRTRPILNALIEELHILKQSSAWLFLLATSILAIGLFSAMHPTNVSASDRTFFTADPNATGDLTPWDHFQIGSSNYKVSDSPKGMTGTGSVTVVPDPLRSQGLVYRLAVGAAANFAAQSAGSDRVDLWNNAAPYMGQEGQETWEHFRLMFPATGDNYQPTEGAWNHVIQHHNDNGYQPFVKSGAIKWEYPELGWMIDTKAKLQSGQRATKLVMRVWGGDDTNPGKGTTVSADEALRPDHWYDMLVHVVWSHDPQRGLVEWWLDGNPIFSQNVANLWQRPDGSIDHVNFEFSNYRLHADWNSAVYFSRVKIGGSKSAVAFNQ